MNGFDLRPDACQVLLVDVQERFLAAIPDIAEDAVCGRTCRILLAGSARLGLPITITEQVPDKLGPTLPFLRAAAGDAATTLSKRHFSVGDDDAARTHLATMDRPQVVVAGIEAHICVLATIDDLLRHGYEVIVATDAVASRRAAHRDAAVATARQLGAATVPVESILFRLLRVAEGPDFKALSALIR